MLRHRRSVLAAWIVVFLIGGFASSKLSAILSNTFSVPGTASETGAPRPRGALRRPLGRVVHRRLRAAEGCGDRRAAQLRQELTTAVGRAAAAVPGGKPLNFNVATTPAGKTVVYGDISSTLNLAQAKGYTDKVIAALGTPAGVENVYVTGAAAIQHDLDPVFNRDLKHGELAIAAPDRAARAAGRLRALVGGDDPADLRGVHDHGHARDRLRRREHLGDADLRDESRPADRVRDRRRLLAADRLPLPRGARGWARDRRRRRPDDADRRPSGRLLRHRRRARPLAARGDAAAVHPDARRRRLPDPGRLDRRRRDAAAGAALLLRPQGNRAPPVAAPRAEERRATASGRGSRARS